MSLSTKVLRSYQALNIERIRRAILNDGAQSVLYSAPMASGKTLIGKGLAANLVGTHFHTILILAPQTAIVDRWREPLTVANPMLNWVPRTYGSEMARAGIPSAFTDKRDWHTPKLSTGDATHADGAFWQGEQTSIQVATRQAVCRREVIDLLKEQRPNLDHMLVICDEAHHHHNEALAGEFCNVVIELGGYVLLVTGTAWSNSGKLLREDTVTIDYPQSRYMRETDEQGRPYAPRNWVVDHERVEEARTNDIRLYSEGEVEKTDPKYKPSQRRAIIARIVKRFVEDECPKTVVNVPRTNWVPEVIKALTKSPEVRALLKKQGRPELRVYDFTGSDKEKVKPVMDLLSAEAEVKHLSESKIDVLVSCARMNEGTDWVPCSHVYNVRIPASMLLILQRWARASRSKLGIAGYPQKYADAQTLVFFTPVLEEEAAADYWTKHRNLAGAMAALLEDYRVASQYVNVCPALERFKKATKKKDKAALAAAIDDVLDAEELDQAWEGTEHDRAEAMGRVILELEKRGGKVVGKAEINALVSRLAKGDESKADEVRQALLTFWERSGDSEMAETVTKGRQAAVKKASKRKGADGCDIIRASMRDTWAAVMEKCPNLMLSSPADARQMAKFSPWDSAKLVDVMRETGGRGGLPDSLEGLKAFALEHGEKYRAKHGKWPNKRCGQVDGLRPTWLALDLALWHRGSSLREVFGKPPLGERLELNARACRHFYDQNGFWPRQNATDSEERRLGTARGNLWRRHPDLCDKYGLPLKADRSEVVRRRFARPQLTTADVVLRLCHQPKATQCTQNVEGDSGATLNTALKNAANPDRRGKSRGVGGSPEALALLMQVNSLARLKQERDADCWRFTLKGAKRPDPRPWAELLASGDNVKVEKAERTHYLDWTDLDRNGQPKRKVWPGLSATTKRAA